MELITSRQNPLMAHIRKLSTSRAYRRQSGEFLGDGSKLLAEAIRWGAALTTIVVSQQALLPHCPGVRTVVVPGDVMASISPMAAPQGALFLGKTPSLAPPPVLTGSRYLVLDGLQDPGNVGTIWRTADALGADGIFLLHDCCDPYGPKTVRATMGAAFRLPVWETDLEALCTLLAGAQLPLYATALREDTVDVGGVNLARCGVVIGSEGAGVCEKVLARCQKTLKIPMEARCESLNAAVAASIVLWEMGRAAHGAG